MINKEAQLLMTALANLKTAQQGITVVEGTLSVFTVSPGLRVDVQWTKRCITDALWALEELRESTAREAKDG